MAPAPEIKRLKVRRQFLDARNGTTERRKTLLIQAVRRPAGSEPWIGEGFTATKKIGNSVIRNRAKRRLRAAAQALLPQYGVSGCDYVFIARAVTAEADWPRLLDDTKSALISLAPCLQGSDEPRESA